MNRRPTAPYSHSQQTIDLEYSTVSDFLPMLFGSMFIFAIVFLILREVMCWYWKINRALVVLTEIRDLLATQASHPTRTMTIEQHP